MILPPDDPSGKPEGADVESTSLKAARLLRRPRLADGSILFNPDLKEREKLLLIALVQMDGLDGRGSAPRNEDLVAICGFRGRDLAANVKPLRTMLNGLVERGYIRVFMVGRSRANLTGRVITLTPKALGWEVVA